MQTCNCGKALNLESLISELEKDSTMVIDHLQKIQNNFGYISEQAVALLSRHLGVPESQIFSVVTFYSQFTLEPKAKHNIEVCMGTACYVLGANKIADAVKEKLNIDFNKTTKDGMFALKQSRCLGCCALAPVVVVDGEIVAKASSEQILEQIKKLKEN